MEPAPQPSSRWTGALIAALVFAAAAPTLPWQEFSSGSENLNVATALEMRRTGNWLLPTLQGQPRLAKPPLTAWITAGLLSQSTLQRLSDPNPAARAAAYRQLNWQVRWPALLCACLTVLATYELARILGGARLAILSALVLGTNYALLRFSRAATTDVQLTLWVAMANLSLATALVRKKYWTGYLGAGLAIGLAFLSKGPVAIVQTLAPAAVFAAWRHYSLSRRETTGHARHLPPLLTGLALMLAVAAPWFVLVIRHSGAGIWDLWFREVTREGATNLGPSKWYSYFSLFPLLLPWIAFFIAGLIVYLEEFRQTTPNPKPQTPNPNALLPLFLLLVPILLMWCFRDKKERYLLPMIGPAAIIAARALILWLTTETQDPLLRKSRPTLVGIHYALLVAAAIVFPIAAALGLHPNLKQADGTPWLPMMMGLSAAAVAALILLLSLTVQQRRPITLVGTTVTLMVMVQAMFAWGYSRSENGLSEMRPLAQIIWSRHPTAAIASFRPGRRAPEDLSIYLNRTVRPIEDLHLPETLNRPGVLVLYQKQEEPMPQPPEGWEYFASARRGKNLWHAFAPTPAPDN